VNNRILIVSLVLCVGVEYYSDFVAGLGDEEWIHGFG
jgi:hypothetical protein